jgi:hypothetical protein
MLFSVSYFQSSMPRGDKKRLEMYKKEGLSDAAIQAVKDRKKKKYWTNQDDYSQGYMATLQRKKETVNLSKVGFVNVSHPKGFPFELIDACKRTMTKVRSGLIRHFCSSVLMT